MAYIGKVGGGLCESRFVMMSSTEMCSLQNEFGACGFPLGSDHSAVGNVSDCTTQHCPGCLNIQWTPLLLS